MLASRNDFPDTAVSFYDTNGILLQEQMAHACLLSRASTLKWMLTRTRLRSTSAENIDETFKSDQVTAMLSQTAARVHRIRIDTHADVRDTDSITEALDVFMQCFYTDLKLGVIDDVFMEKITRHLISLHTMGSRYMFRELVTLCEEIAARCMTRESCEYLLGHFVDTREGGVKVNGTSIVTTCITWARQCTSGHRWRTQLLTYLDGVLGYNMSHCDPTRPSDNRIVLRKCQDCWTVKDTPYPCAISPEIPVVVTTDPIHVSIVWKRRQSGDNCLILTSPERALVGTTCCISDFYRSGTWATGSRCDTGNHDAIIMPAHPQDQLFFADCMYCRTRAPCYIYSLEFISDETDTSMDCS